MCDRPNPIGGDDVEGALLVEGFESFVGQFPIPMRHGMTIGELARLFNEHFAIGADTRSREDGGMAARDMYADATDLPWVMPSPNMPTLDTAIVYPGTVLFEGILISEGRGTTRPFELIGAPWIEAESFCPADERARACRACTSGRRCSSRPSRNTRSRPAAVARFTSPIAAGFSLCSSGVALIAMFHQVDPARFAWRQPPYEYEHDKMPIDILAGSDTLRRQIEAGTSMRAKSPQAGRTDEAGVSKAARAVPHVLTFRVPGSSSGLEPDPEPRTGARNWNGTSQDRVFAIPGAFISCAVGGSR